MLKGFRDFILRGNVIELAVAVVIGAAFNNLVTQFTASFIKPLIILIGGANASGKVHLGENSDLDWGSFVNAMITFLITAAVVYFCFVFPMNKLNELWARRKAPVPKAPTEEVQLLQEIRDALLTQQQAPAPQARGPQGQVPPRHFEPGR